MSPIAAKNKIKINLLNVCFQFYFPSVRCLQIRTPMTPSSLRLHMSTRPIVLDMRLRPGSGPGSMPFSDGVVWIVADLVDGHSLVCVFSIRDGAN